MNGFNNQQSVVTQQLPADSSGIITMSSPSGSSDSGSSGTDVRRGRIYPHGGGVVSGKNMNLMAKVQKISPPSNITPLGGLSPKKLPSTEVVERQKTDLFLSQFQAQMSEMKSAMDAVQHEMLHHAKHEVVHHAKHEAVHHVKHEMVHPGKPAVFKSIKPSGGVGGGKGKTMINPDAPRPRGKGRGRGKSAEEAITVQPGIAPGPITYQSQISASNGLKLKIRKSPNGKRGAAAKGPKRTKAKRRKGEDDDDDISDMEIDRYSIKRRSSVEFAGNRESGDQSAGAKPSGWGDQLPENVLFRIFSHVVKDDGCIPFLVR